VFVIVQVEIYVNQSNFVPRKLIQKLAVVNASGTPYTVCLLL